MKYLILLLLFSGCSFIEKEIPDSVKNAWRSTKNVIKNVSEPPPEVKKYVNTKWGDDIDKVKEEWNRLSQDTLNTKEEK